MMKLSLQSRFAYGTVVLLLLFSAALAGFLGKMFHRAQRQSEENRLKGLVYSLISSMNVTKDGEVEIDSLPNMISEDGDLSIAVFDSNQKQVWGEKLFPAPQTIPQVGEWNYRHLWKQNHASRIAFGLEWEGENNRKWIYTLLMQDSGKTYRDSMAAFRKNLWTWLSLGCLILLTLQLILLKLGFKPLKHIANEVALIEQGKQHKFEKKYPQELEPLTVNINSLLRHERGQQLRYQQSLDNLAHALKTPLTAIKNVSQQKQINDDMLQDLSEQVDRAKDIVDYQLKKASAVGKTPFAKPISVLEIVEKVSRSLKKVYEQKNLNISIHVPQDAMVQINEGDLFEVVGNVMENAAKYGQSIIEVSYQDQILSIEDNGPGFSEQNIQSIVQRGVRQDQRVEGSGIGLSVAYEIVSVFGGSLELGKSSKLGGAAVKIRL